MVSTALLVVDMQQAMFFPDPVHAADQVLQRIVRLIERARNGGVPVVYVQHNEGSGQPLEPGTPGWEIHPAISPLEGDLIIQKRTPDAFHETDLQAALSRWGISDLVVVGFQTEYCIDTTCRRAFSLGYQVRLAQDAHSTWSNQLLAAEQIIRHHNAVLGDWFVKLAEAEVIAF